MVRIRRELDNLSFHHPHPHQMVSVVRREQLNMMTVVIRKMEKRIM